MQPTVLIVGGFLTVPANYWPLRRRLLRRGAGKVLIAPLWPIDWALAGIVGFGPMTARTRNAIIRAERLGGGEPIIVVGHSGGGIAARLAIAPRPLRGKWRGAGEAVGCLVTLGTPHSLARLRNRHRHAGHAAAAFLDRESPGAHLAPRTAYLTVGSNYPRAGFTGLVGRVAHELFSVIVGDDTGNPGDGIVPFSAVHLDGARQLTFEDARHGHIGANWYGSEAIVDRWWPEAVGLWRDALETRREMSVLTG